MGKIKVMHFVSGLVSGGVEQMLVNYCGNMDHNKFDFIVVYQHEPVDVCINKISQAGCETVRITARNESFVKNIIDSYRVIKKYRPDIVHSHMNLMNFCSAFSALILGVKVRISHSHIAEKEKSYLYQKFAMVCKFLIKLSSNMYLACGEEAGKYLYGNKKKFSIINNAINLESFSYTEKNLRANLHLNGKILIGHVGRFTEQKNHKRLINIFKELSLLEDKAMLVLAGTGELEEEIKKYTKKLNIENKVIFLGSIFDMQGFYSSLDLFVLPSLFEGFPVVALEVQAAGVVSLFSDNIDSKIQITKLVHLFSLKKSDKAWANEIISLLNQKKDNSYINELIESGYNIQIEAKKLEKFYLDSLKM